MPSPFDDMRETRPWFHQIFRKLQDIALDPERRKRCPDDSAFVDDMVLQLELWAADIQEADDQPFEWADKLDLVSGPLRHRLKTLEEHTERFDHVTKTPPVYKKKDLDDSDALGMTTQQSLLHAVEDLVALTGLIKMATTIPKDDRTKERSSRINSRLPISISIFDDARGGILVGIRLDAYLKSNPHILSEQDPDSGLTLLGIAVTEGGIEEVEQLVRKGAEPDRPSRNGETPLLLAAMKTTSSRPMTTTSDNPTKATSDRAMIIKLLITKLPPYTIDSTCHVAGHNTPLMYAMKHTDIDSIRMLRRAGASLGIRNIDGFNAKEMAREMKSSEVLHAINWNHASLPSFVLFHLLGILSWAIDFTKTVVLWVAIQAMLGSLIFNPKMMVRRTRSRILRETNKLVENDEALSYFFEYKQKFIKDLTWRAVNLTSEPEPDTLLSTIMVSMYQHVICCNDSSSMLAHRCWATQKQLARNIAKVTTRIPSKGEGVMLRFTNRNVSFSRLSLKEISEVLDSMPLNHDGKNEIGTTLRLEVLEPLVYNNIKAKSLLRPLLISILIGGTPELDSHSTLVEAILECGRRLEEAGYPPRSVKFLIIQIGRSSTLEKYLGAIRSRLNHSAVVYFAPIDFDSIIMLLKGTWRMDTEVLTTLYKAIRV